MADSENKQPEVPSYQQFDVGSLTKAWEDFYKPQTSQDYMDMYSQMMQRAPYDYNMMQNAAYNSFAKLYPSTNDIMMQEALKWAPQLDAAQVANQQALMAGAFSEQMRQIPISTGVQYQNAAQYMPAYTSLFDTAVNTSNPEWNAAYQALGADVTAGLNAGYTLGPELQSEVEQSIRAAQTSRGNWLGPAPTAQEAMGTGQAAIDLYNQRIAQGQDYVNGQTRSGLWGTVAGALPSGTTNAPYYPGSTIDPNAGLSAYGQYSSLGSQLYGQTGTNVSNAFSSIGASESNYNSALGSATSNYNSALLGANELNNNNMYNEYDRQADAFMYNEAVDNGLYSTPQVGGSSSGMSSMIGGIGSAVAGVGGALITSGAVTGGAAIATGVGAAASAAAAALCWLARKLAPECWKSYRKYLFTRATEEEREFYIFNARRLANTLT